MLSGRGLGVSDSARTSSFLLISLISQQLEFLTYFFIGHRIRILSFGIVVPPYFREFVVG